MANVKCICPFPVGAVLQMTTDTDPNDIYAGTEWELMEGRFLLGASAARALGLTGGSETHSLTVGELPAHAHGLNSHTHSVGAHAHGLNGHIHSVGAHSHGLNSHTHTYAKPNTPTGGTAISAAQMPSHNHKPHTWTIIVASGGNTGSGSWTSGGFLEIFKDDRDQNRYTGNAGSGSSHTHTIGTTSTNSGAASGSTANSSAFNSGAASGNTANSSAFDSGAASGDTAEAGGNEVISWLPPYEVVNMWKRVS